MVLGLMTHKADNVRCACAEQDVAWHNHHSHIFGSVGDDKQLIIWDTRQRCKSASSLCFVHASRSPQVIPGLQA